MEKIEEQFDKEKILKISKKFLFLVLAIILMAFAQAILSFTSKIGMAPIDSMTTSFVSLINVEGITYPNLNYIIVTFLVIGAVVVSTPEKRLITSTAAITGFTLALLVQVIADYIVWPYFPGLTREGSSSIIAPRDLWMGILWFLLGFFLITLSIGIWMNVGFALRPYEALINSFISRFPNKNFVFFRNIGDSIFVISALIISLIAFLSYSDVHFFGGSLSVGVGTILFVFCAGYISNFWKKIFSKIV